jgi:hypothetical protein
VGFLKGIPAIEPESCRRFSLARKPWFLAARDECLLGRDQRRSTPAGGTWNESVLDADLAPSAGAAAGLRAAASPPGVVNWVCRRSPVS